MKDSENAIVEKFRTIWWRIFAIPAIIIFIFILDLMFWRDKKYRKFRKDFFKESISFDFYLLKKKIKNKFRKHSEDEPAEEDNASDDIETR
jgi:hypothetical protein